MTDQKTLDDMITRLDVAESRLAALSREPFPEGQTDPDPGAEETWGAAQVWAHLAEFPPFWSAQVRAIKAAPQGTSPAFGRLKTDASRVDPIERDRALPREQLWQKVQAGIGTARATLVTLEPADFERTAQHPVRGTVTLGFVVNDFIVKHLEEHADQLDKLASEAAPS
jgi:hypothetical protein